MLKQDMNEGEPKEKDAGIINESRLRTTDYVQRVTDNEQRATDNEQRSTDNEQRVTANGQRPTDHAQRATTNQPNPWLLATRPKTLGAAIVPVLVGTALAPFPYHWPSFFFALAGSLLIQIATNFINDALDFEKGADRADRLGPIRATQAGLLTPTAVKRAAVACLVAAALCGVPLILRGGVPIVVIGLASMLCAWLYTGGPFPLAYVGLGEIFVILFFGVIAVGGSFYLQALTITRDAVLMGIAIGLLAAALLAINNLRDIPTDRASGKGTLAVRFGATFARSEVAVFAILPYVIAITLALIRPQWSLLFVLITLPRALMMIGCAWRGEGIALNRCLGMAGSLLWAYGLLFTLCAVYR